jgi:hypothetical protein
MKFFIIEFDSSVITNSLGRTKNVSNNREDLLYLLALTYHLEPKMRHISVCYSRNRNNRL